jgi:hypothetical protein
MEGNWRVACLVGVVLACCFGGAAAGCGSDSSGSSAEGVQTRNPEATFAPLVQLDPKERWLPMAADWFLNRAIFGFADDQGCADRPIAVGHELDELWTPAVDYLGQPGIGTAAGTKAYFRTPYAPATPKHDTAAFGTPCPYREGYRIFANQQTRPYEKKDRTPGVRLTEGYYVDLVDRARGGERPRGAGGEGPKEIGAPVYVERRAEEVDGEPGLRLTYWLLYGMNEPLDSTGNPLAQSTHEGDWERVEVLLQEGGGDDEWVPVSVRLLDADGGRRDVRWATVRRATAAGASSAGSSSATATHPVLTATRGDHALSPAPRRGRDCAACPQWPTWSSLAPARKQPWYGFGGAWGQPGKTSETTGPLGPHDKWAPDSPFNSAT